MSWLPAVLPGIADALVTFCLALGAISGLGFGLLVVVLNRYPWGEP